MSQLFAVSLAEKIACLEREIGYREEVYARRVANGTLKRERADREIEIMKAILWDYEELRRGIR